MTKKLLLVLLCIFCLGVACAWADDDDNNNGDVTLKATLQGLNEGPPNNTNGTGTFTATIPADGSPITFTLTWDNLSSPNVLFAHIHFGFPKVNGGVMIFLCGGDSQPACPQTTSAVVNGTITSANVTGPASQGVAPGDLATALRLIIHDGAGYANVHTSPTFGGGEIRGQVHVKHRHHGDD